MDKQVNILIDQLKNKKNTFFVGAGISVNSGIPSANQIKNSILTNLPLQTDHLELIEKNKIPFELFMECLIENAGNDSLVDLFEGGKPNVNHVLLANLCKQGIIHNIITTNFDNLLELALDEAVVEYNLVYNETDFANILWDSPRVNLIKIHGSIHDKKRLAITLKKVSSKELIHQRNQVIEKIFSKEVSDTIAFMGYSCSDIFDINPTVRRSVNSLISIIYLQHRPNLEDPIEVLPLSNSHTPDLFSGFDGHLIRCHTDIFTPEVWNHFLSRPAPAISFVRPGHQIIINKWFNDILFSKGEGFPFYLAGQLLITVTQFSLAIPYFQKGLVISDSLANNDLSVDYLYSIGRAYQSTQKTDISAEKSIGFLEAALAKSLNSTQKRKQAIILLSLGIAYEDKSQHAIALDKYYQSYLLSLEINDALLVSKCYGNMAIVLKNIAIETQDASYLFPVSLIFQNLSLEIAISEGDKRSEGRIYGNIASILSKQNKLTEAISYSEKALGVACELSDVYHEGIWRHNLGEDYITINPEKAEAYLLEAQKIFKREGWENFLTTCHQTLSRLYEQPFYKKG